MSRIQLDDSFHIELTNTFDLIEHRGDYAVKDKTGKPTGEIKPIILNHGYHSTLKQAVDKYAKLTVHSKEEVYTLHDYVNAVEDAFEKAFRQATGG